MPETTEPQLTESDVSEIKSDLAQSSSSMTGVAGIFRRHCAALIRDWRALQAQVTKFSELADKRHDELCEARRQRDSLAADMATHIRDATAALRAENEQQREQYKDLDADYADEVKENAALREQLAETRTENERLSSQLKEWQEDKDTKAGYL